MKQKINKKNFREGFEKFCENHKQNIGEEISLDYYIDKLENNLKLGVIEEFKEEYGDRDALYKELNRSVSNSLWNKTTNEGRKFIYEGYILDLLETLDNIKSEYIYENIFTFELFVEDLFELIIEKKKN